MSDGDPCLESAIYRNAEKQCLSAEDHRKKLKQSEFVQGILSSMMILDDDL